MNQLMNRPAKLKGEYTMYSVLIPNTLLEAMRLVAESQDMTAATVFRTAVERYVMEHRLFKEDSDG